MFSAPSNMMPRPVSFHCATLSFSSARRSNISTIRIACGQSLDDLIPPGPVQSGFGRIMVSPVFGSPKTFLNSSMARYSMLAVACRSTEAEYRSLNAPQCSDAIRAGRGGSGAELPMKTSAISEPSIISPPAAMTNGAAGPVTAPTAMSPPPIAVKILVSSPDEPAAIAPWIDLPTCPTSSSVIHAGLSAIASCESERAPASTDSAKPLAMSTTVAPVASSRSRKFLPIPTT